MKIGQKITATILLPVGCQIKALGETLTYFYAVRVQAGKFLPFIWSSCHIRCAGFKHAVTHTHAAFEGFHIDIEAVVAENDLVVCRIAMSGQHIGDFDRWKASGQQVRFSGMDMHRIEGGRISETWHFENFDGLKIEETA
ncbi:ester cyclase [Pectobacterium parmentieri]|uniref:ester cyclase n=1 Tax=Pectobacterium parmentieri TaxID=1905730 RepID=UPI001F08CC0F|nr:ester cyclase [Pectobacterium parmentieri]